MEKSLPKNVVFTGSEDLSLTTVSILSPTEIKGFDSPPQFDFEERIYFFELPQWAIEIILRLRTPTSKVGFIIQIGYFRAVCKFFVASLFRPEDVSFVLRSLRLESQDIEMEKYTKATSTRHQQLIREQMGYHKFNQRAKTELIDFATERSTKQIKPKLIFWSLVDYLRENKIEIPKYYVLAAIISKALRDVEQRLVAEIKKQLTDKNTDLLDRLLETEVHHQDSQIQRYKLTLLKKFHQGTQPRKIKENVDDLCSLKTLFSRLANIKERLNLSPEITEYYAQLVKKSQIFQISRRDEKRYLLLIAFVIYQYYYLSDVLCEILMQSVQNTLNTTEREHKEQFYQTWRERHETISQLSFTLTDHLATLNQIKQVVYDGQMTDEQKIHRVQSLLPTDVEDYSTLTQQLATLGRESTRVARNEDYYDLLSKKSRRLQNRASQIIKHLEFDNDTSDENLIDAVAYYREKDAKISATAPIDFLEPEEQEVVFNETGKLRISLYKVLLFSKLADALKSGALNLSHSIKYRTFDDYLIPADIFESQKSSLLQRAGLEKFSNWVEFEENLRLAISEQYKITNQNISSGKNEYAWVDSKGKVKLKTPPVDKPSTPMVSSLFPLDRFISLFEVLSTVNSLCNFTDSFEHWSAKSAKSRPDEPTIFAGVIGLGCNLGIGKIAKISRNLNENQLERTVNWYFSVENINGANDAILELTEQLDLPNLYRHELQTTHTSSDGQKFRISVDSLNANYSYKYFGKGKGVSVYGFIDQSHRLFYGTVINPREREAAYVIDGLMHNDVVESNIHSTDTHGYSEMIFGVTHLLGISFAPRISGFSDQTLYGFESRGSLSAKGYQILPEKRIRPQIIRDNFHDILRLVVTIKLKETSASQLFRRLSAYSRQHPLYQAIKEFGKIIKTLFLLTYIDDVSLRQAIEKQINKMESSNKLAKAIFFSDNQEFRGATKEEQLQTEGCKRLIANAIICWNYLYLTQLIGEAETENHKQALIETIKNSSPAAWRHINMEGEYDFSKEKLEDSIEFRLPELLEVRVS